MAGLDKVFSPVLPPAAAAPSLSRAQDPILAPNVPSDISDDQDKALADLMNEFLAEEAKSQPPLPPLGTTHAVEQVTIESEEALRQCLENFDPKEINEQQMMQQSKNLMNFQLSQSNKFFAELLSQPKGSLPQWLANQDKLMIQSIFLGSKQTQTMLKWGGAILTPMIPPDILEEWTLHYPLALLRVQEQPELQGYIPNDLEEKELMSQMFSQLQDAIPAHAKTSLEEEDIKAPTQFFEKFLAIKDDEEAKAWLIAQQNKKDPKDPECYSYPFSKVGALVTALDNKPAIQHLKRCLEGFNACAKRLKKMGLEHLLNEIDPQNLEKLQQGLGSILSFFKDLQLQLKKEPANPELIKKWIEKHDSFKYLPFLVAKSSVIHNFENIPRECRPIAQEIGKLYNECLPIMKDLRLEAYLKSGPHLQQLGLTQQQIEKFNSLDI
jgi:hypothetical protein